MLNPTNMMTVNQQAIYQNAPKYIESYTKRFGTHPTNWWGFPYWFRVKTGLTLSPEDMELVKQLLA